MHMPTLAIVRPAHAGLSLLSRELADAMPRLSGGWHGYPVPGSYLGSGARGRHGIVLGGRDRGLWFGRAWWETEKRKEGECVRIEDCRCWSRAREKEMDESGMRIGEKPL